MYGFLTGPMLWLSIIISLVMGLTGIGMAKLKAPTTAQM